MKRLEDNAWNPYLCGAISGLLLIFSVLIAGKYFGASTTFVRSVGLIEKMYSAERVAGMAYFQSKVPKIDWQFMFVLGVLIGAFIAAKISGTFQWQAIPTMWHQRFGPSLKRRGIAAFIGGVIIMFGARLAGG